MTQVKLGDKNIPFIYQGKDLLYPNPVKDGLVLWYDFKGMKNSDVSKNVARDLSGNGNNGVLSNFSYTDTSGYNNGLNLDGVDDSVSIGDKPSVINLNLEVTVEMSLIFKETPTFWRWLIGNVTDSAGNAGYALAYSPESTKRISFMAGGTVISTGYNIQENEKIHIVGKIDKDKNISIYLNGVKTKSLTAIKNMNNSSLPITIGKASYYSSPLMKSNVFSTKIYNRALTDQEIQHNYKLEKERWGL
ncbi:hypothetical protein CW674_02370 [Macrococcoides caseolyticum]|uniref:LamG-like jellyroll fold domain-containing protein n=1 Tax=Macrococcoides caseolyticum TaxID=69966 RepID=UPI000C33AD18|nr:LamG-like jellyroll fold domain-containing protein [Macrococcus caseolyticus]PKE36335.1 hypothetical protein CW695_03030 [Macrococcus caseolyticus]PKE66216.1 hypothetical protein CW674_02370 [Macrococcus caseolyticus]PKE74892.1 hypothetical protein CW670_04050 [Macrococcus caseolyticus]